MGNLFTKPLANVSNNKTSCWSTCCSDVETDTKTVLNNLKPDIQEMIQNVIEPNLKTLETNIINALTIKINNTMSNINANITKKL